mgnify:CR=1 FL=1
MNKIWLWSFLLIIFPGFLFAQDFGYLIKSDDVCELWWAENTYKIMKDDPAPFKKGKITIQAARNESEGFQIVLLPGKSLENISVSVSDFKQKSGNTIEARNVAIRKVEYVNVVKPSGIFHKAGWYPDPLPLIEKPFNAEKGVNSPVWFTVKVPKGASSGKYYATVVFKSAGWQASVPVELEVWNFTLPDNPYMRSAFGLYSDMIRQYHNLSNDEELKQVLDKYYTCFKELRISPQKFYDLYPIRKKVKGVWWDGGTFDPDTVFSGRYSYQVSDNSTNGNAEGQFSDLISIDPSRPYILKWWAKTLKKNQQYAVMVLCYTSEKKLIPWQMKGMICSGNISWHEDSVYIDPVNPLIFQDMVLSRPFPHNAAFASVHLNPDVPDRHGSQTGTAWFDNFRFIDLKSGKNILPRGDFEQNIEDLDVELDFSAFDLAAKQYLATPGFTGFRIQVPELRPGPYYGKRVAWFNGFINGTAEYDKLADIYFKGIQDHLEANGWLGKEYVYWIDEPKHDDYTFVREGMDILHRTAPKLTRFITENNPGPEIMDVTEIGCPVLAKFDPEKSKEWIARGRGMWSYLMTWPKAPHVNLFIDSDAINMRMWLWMSYKYHLTGILVWSSNCWNAEGCSPHGVFQNIWEDPMTYMDGNGLPDGAAAEYGNGDGMFFYPPNRDPNNDKTKYLTGPVPSLRIEILREGIEDYDYMIMLEHFVRSARPGQQNLVRAAEKILDIKQDVFVNDQEYTKDPRILMKYRQQMGKLLSEFSNKNL